MRKTNKKSKLESLFIKKPGLTDSEPDLPIILAIKQEKVKNY